MHSKLLHVVMLPLSLAAQTTVTVAPTLTDRLGRVTQESRTRFTVTCKNSAGTPRANCATTVYVMRTDFSGGHLHDTSWNLDGSPGMVVPPGGTVGTYYLEGVTDVNGNFSFDYVAPVASGDMTLYNYFTDVGLYQETTIHVQVSGLQQLPLTGPGYRFLRTRDHADYHNWATLAFNQKFLDAVSRFRSAPRAATPPDLVLTGVSLVQGGLFDVTGQWGAPLTNHRLGSALDIAVGNLSDQDRILLRQALLDAFGCATDADCFPVPGQRPADQTSNHWHVALGRGY